MTKEPKGELDKMNWKEIFKLSREDDPSRRKRMPARRKPPVKQVGGKDYLDAYARYTADESFEDVYEDANEAERFLSELTRNDLIEEFYKKLDALTDKEIIDILIKTKGNLKEVLR